MILTRDLFSSIGVFGKLTSGDLTVQTLEHAYLIDGKYQPKIPPGEYTCVRGEHKLHGMDHTFETFSITGVPGHTNLLFHWGNYNVDSEGCVLVGGGRTTAMILDSRIAFTQLMDSLKGLDRTTLTVRNVT